MFFNQMFNRLTDPFCRLFELRLLVIHLLRQEPSTFVRRTLFSGTGLNYRAAILSIFFIFLFISTGFANTFYVSTTGNDNNSATSSQPWRTIQKAANTMVAGDTLIVNAGNFSSERVQVTKSGTAGMPITYQTQGTVVMKGFSIYADYITIKGFEITDTDNDNTNGYGVFIRKASNCVIEENYIHYATRGGITMWAPPGEGTSI